MKKIISSFPGKYLLLLAFYNFNFTLDAQQCYDDFEGRSLVHYNTQRSGHLDSLALNPIPGPVNSSAHCARYIRGRSRYDNIKIYLEGKLENVSAYSTYEGTPPRFKIKVFTNAPVGTLVELQLGKRTGNAYPEGTHSQYQAYTKLTGEWEELEFTFSQVPKGSHTKEDEINQVTLLFYPNSNTNDIYYFDDLTGPGFKTQHD